MKPGAGRKAAPAVFVGILILVALIDLLALLGQYRWVGVPRPGFLVDDAMRVVALQDPRTGMQIGNDVILRVDGHDVSHPWDLQAIVDASGDGEVHEYLLARPGGEATASVSARIWQSGDTTSRVAIPFLLSLVFVAVAVLTFWKARMQDASAPLLGLCGALAAIAMAPHLPLKENASPEPWALAALPFAIATAVHLTMGYPAAWRGLKDRAWLRFVPYILAGILALMVLLVYPGIRSGGSSALTLFIRFMAGAGWLVTLVGAAVIAQNLFETARRSAAPGARVLARIELEAAVCAFVPLILLSGMAWLWPHPGLQILAALSSLAVPLFPLGILAGLARFKIIQVQKWYEYGTVGVLSAAGLILVYAPGVAVLSYVSALYGWDDSAAHVIGTVSATVLCPLVINWTRRLLDWLFERRKADFGQVVGEFAQAIRHLVKAEDLLKAFMARSEQAFQGRYLLVFWREEGEDMLLPRTVLGIAQERVKPLKPDDPSFPRYVGAFALKGVDPAARGERQAKGMAIVLRPELDGPAQALVVIGPRRTGEAFGPDDFELLTLLGDQLQVGLEHVRLIVQVADQEKLRHELEMARQVQMGLLPKRLPNVPGMEVSGSSEPALEVGGDLYDIVELEGGRVGILVGDVSGKGMPAALLMSTALASFRTAYMRYDSPSALLTRLNEVVAGNRPKEDMFVAICYAIWEPAGRLIIANGGMPMPLLNGEELKCKGPPLGMIGGYTYREHELPMSEGDVLLFWSDGLEDVHEERGRTFGVERVMEIAKKGGFTAESLRMELLETCLAFRGAAVPFDDITIVTARSVPVGLSSVIEPMSGAYA